VDSKEEPGRRVPAGVILPGANENEEAAKIAAEMACFANTPGGGALILGVADKGERVGTAIDADWPRHRLYELAGGTLILRYQRTSADNSWTARMTKFTLRCSTSVADLEPTGPVGRTPGCGGFRSAPQHDRGRSGWLRLSL
jgi:hypothetical protein